MDSFEIDSEASLDFNTEDFALLSPSPHPSTPEITKRLQELETEAEKLRLSLEDSKMEVESLKASNQGLKTKIGELFQEAQVSLEEKLRLENKLKDAECQLALTENSSKWYQARLHESEASNRTLTADLEAYQKILVQREQTIADFVQKLETNVNFKAKCQELEEKYLKSQQNQQNDQNQQNKDKKLLENHQNDVFDDKIAEINKKNEELTKKLEETRKQNADLEKQLDISEKRCLNLESSKNLTEKSTKEVNKKLEKLICDFDLILVEKNEAVEKLKVLDVQNEDLRIENERLNIMLLGSKKEKIEVEEGIVELRLQLMKMIAQYKAMKSRSLEAEKRVGEVERENKRLKVRSVAVQNSLLKKVEQEKRKCGVVEEMLKEERAKSIIDYQKGETVNSMTICLQQSLNREKELRDRLKQLSKSHDESVDEGYADSAGFPDIPLPSTLNSGLMNFAVNVLMRSQNFMAPVNSSLDELEAKIKRLSAGDCGLKCR